MILGVRTGLLGRHRGSRTRGRIALFFQGDIAYGGRMGIKIRFQSRLDGKRDIRVAVRIQHLDIFLGCVQMVIELDAKLGGMLFRKAGFRGKCLGFDQAVPRALRFPCGAGLVAHSESGNHGLVHPNLERIQEITRNGGLRRKGNPRPESDEQHQSQREARHGDLEHAEQRKGLHGLLHNLPGDVPRILLHEAYEILTQLPLFLVCKEMIRELR